MTRPTLMLHAAASLAAVLLLGGAVDNTQAAKQAQPNEARKKVVARHLDNPSGIAIQPGTGHVFFSSRDGVRRLVPGAEKPTLEITGYATDIYGKGPKYNIGPLGLAFLNKNQLVVGGGSREDGSELVHVYEVGEEPATQPQQEADAKFTLGPIKPSEKSVKGEGNFYAVAANPEAIFVSCNGDDTKGWVARSDLSASGPGALDPAIATKVATGVDAPVPLTFSPQGDLVVGQMGEINIPGDSLLTIYDPQSGQLKYNAETGLNDLTGLAYSPKTGKLYALDFSWIDTTQGGLFRLDIQGNQVKATKIASLVKPTALAFDKQGKLYITVYGEAQENSRTAPGKVVVIDAGL